MARPARARVIPPVWPAPECLPKAGIGAEVALEGGSELILDDAAWNDTNTIMESYHPRRLANKAYCAHAALMRRAINGAYMSAWRNISVCVEASVNDVCGEHLCNVVVHTTRDVLQQKQWHVFREALVFQMSDYKKAAGYPMCITLDLAP